MKGKLNRLRPWLTLWSTQSLSALGSGMTSFALVLWLYRKDGSALETALLSVCSYAPYVLMSVFAGALSDRWNKKRTMLICDMIAAMSTAVVYALLRLDRLAPWHIYLLNALNGLMNSVQQPAAEVAQTLLLPGEEYQRTSALRSFSGSMNTILTPVLASAVFALGGMTAVIIVDMATFAVAWSTLMWFIPIPEAPQGGAGREGVVRSALMGLQWLRENRLVLNLIRFLACINLVASAYEAALPALLLPRPNGGAQVLGLVNGFTGIAALMGSAIVALLPAPRDRVRMTVLALTVSMSTENFLLAFGRVPAAWCVGAIMGWLPIPLMDANLDVIFRTTIPPKLQGRVYACRNTLQFFTIPVGYFLGGILVDAVCEPLMAAQGAQSLLARLFGTGKGSGAALLYMGLGLVGVAVCAVFGLILRRYRFEEPKGE